MEVAEILCHFKLVLEGKTGKVILETLRIEFLEKFSANNFALSDTEDNTSFYKKAVLKTFKYPQENLLGSLFDKVSGCQDCYKTYLVHSLKILIFFT